jgi:hypothetical protein
MEHQDHTFPSAIFCTGNSGFDVFGTPQQVYGRHGGSACFCANQRNFYKCLGVTFKDTSGMDCLRRRLGKGKYKVYSLSECSITFSPKLVTEERDILQVLARGLSQFAGTSFNDYQDLEISMTDIVLLS